MRKLLIHPIARWLAGSAALILAIGMVIWFGQHHLVELVIAAEQPRPGLPRPNVNTALDDQVRAWNKDHFFHVQYIYDLDEKTYPLAPSDDANLIPFRSFIARGYTGYLLFDAASHCLALIRAGRDPATSLADLDALHTASRHPDSCGAAWHSFWIDRERDIAYLFCARAGTLPDNFRQQWLDEPDDQRQCLLMGMEGTRLIQVPEMAREWQSRPYARVSYKFYDYGATDPLTTWWQEPTIIAKSLANLRADQDLLAHGGYPPRDPDPGIRYEGPSADDYVRFCIMAIASHRMYRLAVRILALRDTQGHLPADSSGFTAAGIDLGAGADRASLCYDRPDDGTFVIRVDPAQPETPLTAIIWRGRPLAKCLGKGTVYAWNAIEVKHCDGPTTGAGGK